MITAVVSTTFHLPFTLLDSVGAPVSGKVNANFTKKAKLRGVGTTITPTVAEDGDEDGVYDVVLAFTRTGLWYVTWSVSVDGETARFEEIVSVITRLQAGNHRPLGG